MCPYLFVWCLTCGAFVVVDVRPRPDAKLGDNDANHPRHTSHATQRDIHVLATEWRRTIQRLGVYTTGFRIRSVYSFAAHAVQLQYRRKSGDGERGESIRRKGLTHAATMVSHMFCSKQPTLIRLDRDI